MKLHYQHYGQEKSAGAPPLLILHGLLGASGNWHTLSRSVFGERFAVYAIDQRNHGRSPHAGAFDYPTLADDVRDFLDQHEIEQAHLLGHSMGGKTAMQMALAYPERTQTLIVADIAPKAYPPHHLPLLEALAALDPSAYESREAIDEALAEEVPSRPVRQFLLKNLAYEDGRYAWQMNLPAIREGYDAISSAIEAGGCFGSPTLFLRGEESDYVAEEDLGAIRKLFPEAKLETIKGAGHWLHADQPDAFGEAVMAFLRES